MDRLSGENLTRAFGGFLVVLAITMLVL